LTIGIAMSAIAFDTATIVWIPPIRRSAAPTEAAKTTLRVVTGGHPPEGRRSRWAASRIDISLAPRMFAFAPDSVDTQAANAIRRRPSGPSATLRPSRTRLAERLLAAREERDDHAHVHGRRNEDAEGDRERHRPLRPLDSRAMFVTTLKPVRREQERTRR